MKHIKHLIALLKEFKQLHADLSRKYKAVSSILIFPSIKNLLDELRAFEKSKYLDCVQGRNYQKLVAQLNGYIKEAKGCARQLEIFHKSTRDYIEGKYDKSLAVPEKKGGEPGVAKFSNYFSFDDCLNVYDVFLAENYSGTPALLYQSILSEKLKRKRRRIEELNAEAERFQAENKTRLFIEFLKRYDPYDKRLRIDKPTKSTREIPRSLMRREVAHGGQTPKEHLMKLIQLKAAEMRECSSRNAAKKDLLSYAEFTAHLIELLGLERLDMLQKLCNDEFYLMKARKFVSILFEDNKKENEQLVRGMEQLKNENTRMRVDIERFKHSFMASLNY